MTSSQTRANKLKAAFIRALFLQRRSNNDGQGAVSVDNKAAQLAVGDVSAGGETAAGECASCETAAPGGAGGLRYTTATVTLSLCLNVL